MTAPLAIHPELRAAARFLPRAAVGPWVVPVVRFFMKHAPQRPPASVIVEDVVVPGPGASVPVRVYRPRESTTAPAPVLLWMHGGGFVIGAPSQDDALCARFATTLGAVVVSVDYRLAPEHPHPAALEDCFSALRWVKAEAGRLGLDASRVAIGGASAGGGLAAGLAQLARDRGEAIVFQLLVYPMLDDRTVLRTDVDERLFRLWNQKANRFGWQSHLGRAPGGDDVTAPAAPARCNDLAGLAPAWIGVGSLDLFSDEDQAYAARLSAAGVAVRTEVVPGAFHGFDAVAGDTAVANAFFTSQCEALRQAFTVPVS